MKKYLRLLALTALCTPLLMSFKTVDDEHFLIKGNLVEMDLESFDEAGNIVSKIVVYQDDEIYAAFDTNEKGDYEFNLPNEHFYEIHFGYGEYVIKKIAIDARDMKSRRGGYEIDLDVMLFKEMPNMTYTELEEPLSVFYYEPMTKRFEQDYIYADSKFKEMKALKKRMIKTAKKNKSKK